MMFALAGVVVAIVQMDPPLLPAFRHLTLLNHCLSFAYHLLRTRKAAMLSTNQLSAVSRNAKVSYMTAVFIIFLFIYHYRSLSHDTIHLEAMATSREHGSPPPQTPSRIPKTLWYKLGPKGLNEQTRAWTDTCINRNPDYHVNFLTDHSADVYVQQRFGSSRPDLVEIYHGLSGVFLFAHHIFHLPTHPPDGFLG